MELEGKQSRMRGCVLGEVNKRRDEAELLCYCKLQFSASASQYSVRYNGNAVLHL